MFNDVRLLLLTLWLGAAIFFSAVVAPSAFATLRSFQLSNSSEIAGNIVSHALAIINTSGLIVSVLLLLTAFAIKRRIRQRAFLVEIVSLVVLAISTATGHWVIAAKMHALRAAQSMPLEQVSVADPRRVAFASLHGYSVRALAVAMIAALITFFAVAHRSRTNDRKEPLRWR